MSSFVLTVPKAGANAVRWAAHVVFCHMLGVPVQIVDGRNDVVALSANDRSLEMPTVLFAMNGPISESFDKIIFNTKSFYRTDIFPELTLEAPIPALLGSFEFVLEKDRIQLGMDVLGIVFLLLSRLEEVGSIERDIHDRFPATSSLAYQSSFLDRPIVDECVEVVWVAMKRLWPGLERKRREGRVIVTCDVDHPFDRVGTSSLRLARSIMGDLSKRGNAGLAVRRCANFIAQRFGDYRFDPYYTFEWYLDMCDRAGRRGTFFFIADRSAGRIDGDYDINEPRLVDLIRMISERGHEIGMHGSYNSYRDPGQITRERRRLVDACASAGVDAPIDGNRQHYLRWDATETPEHLNGAGFTYDSTGSFADAPGFRYGTSKPFPMWGWHTNGPLDIEQRPLVLMERSIIADKYLGLGHSDEALSTMLKLKERAMRYGGDFTLLWHNSHLTTAEDRAFFQELIS